MTDDTAPSVIGTVMPEEMQVLEKSVIVELRRVMIEAQERGVPARLQLQALTRVWAFGLLNYFNNDKRAATEHVERMMPDAFREAEIMLARAHNKTH